MTAPRCTPIELLRKPKLLGMSIFDWVVSLLFAILVGYFILKLKSIFSYIVWFILWTLFGIIVHRIFNVNTMLGYYLGLNPKPVRKQCV